MAFDSREFEFADTKVILLGKELTGLRGLTYKKSQEKELVYGAGNEAKGIQSGNKKNDGTLMLLKSDVDDLETAARLAGYDSILDIPAKDIDIVCVYQKEDGGQLQTVSCISVGFTELEDGMKQADKFKEISLPFLCLRIKKI